jgi:flagellar hook-associated protein 3 FlgL
MSLAINAGNGTMSSAQLTSVQTQVASLRDAVVSMANTSYQGQYLFAGSQGNTKPFSVDTSTDPATATYHGDSVVQTTTTPDGQQVPVNLAGSNVFMAQSSNLLGTLNKLVSDLGNAASSAAAGATDVTAVVADSTALNSALGTVSAQRATLDSSLARLQTANTYASSQSANYTAQQSALLSADPATLATDLKTAEVQQQALLGVTSTLEGQQNLFTYLKGG